MKVGHCLAAPRVSSVDGPERDATGRDHCCHPYQPGERTSPNPRGPPQMQYRGDGRIGVVVAKLLCRRPNVNFDLFGETRRLLALRNTHRAARTGEGLRPSPAPLPGPSAPDISINSFPPRTPARLYAPSACPEDYFLRSFKGKSHNTIDTGFYRYGRWRESGRKRSRYLGKPA